MSAKHTQGPWRAFSHPSHGYCICPAVSGAAPLRDSFAVVSFADTSRGYGSEEARANARLIAAAPQLLAALSDLVELANTAMQEANRDGAEYDRSAELNAARVAIATAVGEMGYDKAAHRAVTTGEQQ